MYQIKRAIILAAGRGQRLKPYTNKTPKPLLPVKGMPIIEQSIIALKTRGINDITIVIGYKHLAFSYLVQKYGVELRYNKNWNKGSNLLSLQCAIDKIEDCIIFDGDVILSKDAIRTKVYQSGYVCVKMKKANEWKIELDASTNEIKNVIADLTEKKNFLALHSISFWVGEQAKQYQMLLKDAKDEVNYVDDIAITIPHLKAYIMNKSSFLEIDTTEEYENAQKVR